MALQYTCDNNTEKALVMRRSDRHLKPVSKPSNSEYSGEKKQSICSVSN